MASVGMFMDGTIYASISRNMAEGLGSMWAPHFSDGLFPVFREHPPLVFWLQSLFFGVLGDTYLTERAYDLFVLLATAALMGALWLRVLESSRLERLAGYWWLVLLLWVVVPKWSWTYRNNVLENTMTMFCLLSVLLTLAGLRSRNIYMAICCGGSAALAALLALLAKGPAALFVLAAPVFLMPALPRIVPGRVVIVLAALSGTFLLSLGALLAWPDAREMLFFYWHKQVVGRSGVSAADIDMLLELAKKLVPMLVVLAGLRLWIWRDGKSEFWWMLRGPGGAMLVAGFAGSLPLLLGDLDSAHYLVPALPFFALGFGLIGAAMLDSGGSRVRAGVTSRPGPLFKAVAISASIGILAMSLDRLGAVRKNEDRHEFLSDVARVAGERRVVGVDSALYSDWYLHAIAQRHFRISLVQGLASAEWRVVPAGSEPEPGYRESGIRSQDLALRHRMYE